jgi:hypothetical protein
MGQHHTPQYDTLHSPNMFSVQLLFSILVTGNFVILGDELLIVSAQNVLYEKD